MLPQTARAAADRCGMGDTVFVADIGARTLSAAVLDRDGKVLARRTESLDASATVAPIKQLLRIATELSLRRFQHCAAAVAVPGFVRRDGGVSTTDLPGWHKFPLGRMLAPKLRVPIFIIPDRNAAALGETWRGAGRGKKDVVVVTAGTRVSVGLICGGRLLRGAHELSGAAGWMVVNGGDSFEVRKFGGLDASASEAAIVRAARAAVQAGLGGELAEQEPEAFTAEEIADLARRGNATCKQIYARAGKLLGLAVANLVSLFDPDVVVFGGSLAAASDLFWDELAHTALARCHPITARQVRLRLSGLGEDANLYGAGYAAWQGFNAGKTTPGLQEDPHQVTARNVKQKPARAHAASR